MEQTRNPSPAGTGRAAPRRHRPLRIVAAAVALLFVSLMIGLLGTAWWVWRDEAGVRWALRQVPGLQIDGLHGVPSAGAFGMQRLVWTGGKTRVEVQGFEWRDSRWHWRPYPGAWIGIELVEPTAGLVAITTAPPEGAKEPAHAPHDVHLPVELAVRGLRLASVRVNALPALSDVQADVHLGAEQGALHRLDRLSLRSDALLLQARGSIRSDASMPVEAQASIASATNSALPWKAELRASGPLDRLALEARAQQGAGARLQASATVAPFAAWPLSSLDAEVSDLDLAGLVPGLPATKLAGSARVQSAARDAPLEVALDVRNEGAGAWDAARLPLRRLQAQLRSPDAALQSIELRRLDAELGGTQDAGTLHATGRWQGRTLDLEARFDALQPARLDTRAAPMEFAGPMTLHLEGLPLPGGGKAAAGALQGRLAAELAGSVGDKSTQAPLQVQLDGGFTMASAADALAVDLRRLQARAGAATATLTARAERDARRRWRLRSEGRLDGFDPGQWLNVGALGLARTRGSALNARWQAALDLPEAALSQPPMQWLDALRGDAALDVPASRVFGLPIHGKASLRADDAAANVAADIALDRNRASLTGRLGRAADDRWQAELQAPALAALRPLLLALPATRDWALKSGTLTAKAEARGRWPALHSSGQLRAGRIETPALRLGAAQLDWQFSGLDVNAPLTLHLRASDLSQGAQKLDRLDVTASGTPGTHRVALDAASPLRPPSWTRAVLGDASRSGGSSLVAELQGHWRAAGPGGGQWTGRLQQLRAGARSGTGTPWVEARNLDAELRIDPNGGLAQASLAPGRLDLLGSALRWREARWQAAASPSGAAKVALDADLEPMRVAPWLAAMQPEFGWAGDLAIGAQVRLHTGPSFEAEARIARSGGDLRFKTGGVALALGLTELRLQASAREHAWRLTQALAGTKIGSLAGAQTLPIAGASPWPNAGTPLSGSLDLRLAELGIWTPLLPAGWSLGGQIRTRVELGGRVGAPAYTGDVTGVNLAASNLLQGVHLTDGELHAVLRGDEARLERLTFKGGEGTLRAQGAATFGAAPQARVHVEAAQFAALNRIDRQVIVSGKADVALQSQRVKVDGNFLIDKGLIDITEADAARYDADVVVVNAPAGSTHAASASTEARDAGDGGADVSVAVDLGQHLQVKGHGIDTGLRGQIRVATPKGKLAITGTVRTEGGTYTAYSQNLAIERGLITFVGDPSDPTLDIRAVRADIDTRVGVVVTGTAVNPRVRLYSEDSMSDMERLSWLMLGRAPTGIGGADMALLQRAALAFAAGDKGDSKDGFVQKLGLDELSVGGVDKGDVRSAVVTVGKQLSKRLFVGYERGLNAAAGSWQLLYRVAQRITLRARTGAENALDAIWSWRWD